MNRREFFLKMIGTGVGLAVAAAVDPPKLDRVNQENFLPEKSFEVKAVPFEMLTGLPTSHGGEGVWRYRIRRQFGDLGAF